MNTHRFDDLKNDAYQKLNETQSILDNMSDRAKVERDVVLNRSEVRNSRIEEFLSLPVLFEPSTVVTVNG